MSDGPVWLRRGGAGDEALIALHVVPGARASRVMGTHGERLRVQIAAPPVDGKANRAIEDCFAGWMNVSRSCVKVVRGLSSREKTLAIACDDLDSALARLMAAGAS